MSEIQETLDFINSKTNCFKPKAAIVLGSSMACFTEGLRGIRIPYAQIPNFAISSVKGHKGELLFAKIENVPCVIMEGRFHYYEGNPMDKITFPYKVFREMGVETLILTNAAGACNPDYNIGDIVLINDHINFMGSNPLIGERDNLGEMFPDMSNCYDRELCALAKKCAKKLNIDLKEGVYFATSGPSYETKAEIRAFRILGADLVGMSTVPEAIMASYLKIKTLAFSTVTNKATGLSESALSHAEVLSNSKSSSQNLSILIEDIIKNL